MTLTTADVIQLAIAIPVAIPFAILVVKKSRKWFAALAQLLPNGGTSLADKVSNVDRLQHEQMQTLRFQNKEIRSIKEDIQFIKNLIIRQSK